MSHEVEDQRSLLTFKVHFFVFYVLTTRRVVFDVWVFRTMDKKRTSAIVYIDDITSFVRTEKNEVVLNTGKMLVVNIHEFRVHPVILTRKLLLCLHENVYNYTLWNIHESYISKSCESILKWNEKLNQKMMLCAIFFFIWIFNSFFLS